jgi:hypothetical protein
MKMKNESPVFGIFPRIMKHHDEILLTEQDPDMKEIEDAKKHFEDQSVAEAFWAGRLLADRKSTRIAA